MRKIGFIRFLIFTFIATTIVLNLVWYMFVYGKLYYCSDPIIFPLMFPPYVHEFAPDYYIANPYLVNTLGVIFLITNFAIPIIVSKSASSKLEKLD